MMYSFVNVAFFHTAFLDYGLPREACNTGFHEKKTKRKFRGDIFSYFSPSKLRSAASIF